MIDPLLTETEDAIVFTAQGASSFGFSAANAGDVNGDGYADVIVGAIAYDDDQSNEGAVFVYHGSASGIDTGVGTENAMLTSDVNGGIGFGVSIAGAGDVNGDGYADVIVGATAGNASYVFHGSATGIVGTNPASAAAQLTCTVAGESFGISVAGAGDTNADGYDDVIVGAWVYDNGQINEGAVFVFRGSASGVGTRTQLLANQMLESNQATAAFGISVAGAGDVNSDGYADVIVGSQWWEAGPLPSPQTEGAAFVYHGGPGALVLDATVRGGQANMWLGRSVAGAGDVNGDGFADVIAGAPNFDFPNVPGAEGGAWVFYGGPNGIVNQVASAAFPVLIGDEEPNAQFGNRVAGAGDVNGDGYADVTAAAPFDDDANPDEGAVFVYLGTPLGISGVPFARVDGNQGSPDFGSGLAGAGDVNGDGYADVIVGASVFDAGAINDGAAFVYHGGGSGLGFANVVSPGSLLNPGVSNSDFGRSVSSADVNGDGHADVIVGDPGYDNGQTDEGAAFVWHGSASGINEPAVDTLLQSNQSGALFGKSVSGAGDVNGDGYADLIVGAESYDAFPPFQNEGTAFVFMGSASGIADGNPTTANARIIGDSTNDYIGTSVASAGDVNGDGYGDVIVGAEFFGVNDEGAAFVFHGSASGMSNVSPYYAGTHGGTHLVSDQIARMGHSVAGAGDVNGDGYGDVLVGAPDYDSPEADGGAAFVFLGSASGIPYSTPTTAATRLVSNAASTRLGWSVSGAGDVNGDRYGDVIVGREGFLGAAYVFHGSATGIADANAATAATQLESSEFTFGESVSGAGDVNGDGYGDVVVGAPSYFIDADSEGVAFVFHGSASGIASGHPQTAATRIYGNNLDGLAASVSAGDVER